MPLFSDEKKKKAEEALKQNRAAVNEYYQELNYARTTPAYSEQQINNLQNQYSQLKRDFGSWDKDSIKKTSAGIQASINTLRQQNAKRGRFADRQLENYLKGLEDYIGYVDDTTNSFDTRASYNKAVRESGYREKYQGMSRDDLVKANIDIMKAHGGSVNEESKWLLDYMNSDEVMTADDYAKAAKREQGRAETIRSSANLNFQKAREEGAEKYAWMAEYGVDPSQVISTDAYKQLLQSEGAAQQASALYNKYQTAAYWKRQDEQYSNLKKNADFAENSKYDPSVKDGIYQTVMQPQKAMSSYAGATSRGEYAGALSPERLTYMSDEDRATFSYLWNTPGYGKDAAMKFLYDNANYSNSARQMEDTKATAKMLGSNWITGIPSSIASIPMNLTSGAGFMDAAIQNARNWSNPDDYKPVNYGSTGLQYAAMSSGIREGGTERWNNLSGTIHIDKESHPFWHKVLDGKGLGDAYQLTMSMADSAAIAALGGGFGTVLLGGSAATQGILDAVGRGATDGQALLMGFLNGAFETAFEYMSIEHLLNKLNFKSAWQQIASQAFAEGSEEFNTTLFNTMADILVMAQNSEYMQNAQKYIEQGMTPEEAQKQALADFVVQIAWDAIGGALSGGIMGAGHFGMERFQQNSDFKKIYNEASVLEALCNEALELDSENELAQKLKEKGKATGGQINRLVQQNEQAIQRNAAQDRLTELGETENVRAVAQVIEKSVEGKRLTKADWATLRASKYGTRVLNELRDTSGEYANGWTQNIGNEAEARNESVRSMLADLGKDFNLDDATTDAVIKSAMGEELTEDEQALISTGDTQRIAELARAMTENPDQLAAYDMAKTSPDESGLSQRAKQAIRNGEGYRDTGKSVERTISQQEEQAQTQRQEAKKAVSIATGQMTESPKTLGFQSLLRMRNDMQDEIEFENGMRRAYEMGQAGLRFEDVVKSPLTSELTNEQVRAAYDEGRNNPVRTNAPKARSNAKQGTVRAENWTVDEKGTIKVEGMKLSDLKKRFNSAQKTQFKYLEAIAKAKGYNLVFFDSRGNEKIAQGKFDLSNNDTIYIDISAGLIAGDDITDLGKYTMLRTFTHELVHHGELWAPDEWNELRETVFKHLPNAEEMIDNWIRRIKENPNLNVPGDKLYDYASREVVAEGMVDILPQTEFLQDMYENHQNIFQKIWDTLKQFIADLKAAFARMGESTPEARALKQQIGDTVQYAEGIVKAFDKMAKAAAENMKNAPTPETATAKDITAKGIQSVVGSDGKKMFQLRTMKQDVDLYMQDLKDAGLVGEGKVMSETELDNLYQSINKVMDFVEHHINEIERNESFRNMDETNRPFLPYKSNSDPHYKMALDYSTLCRKRLLTQAITERLQASLKRALTPVEQVKIRNEIKKLQAEGKKLDVACALCYVEAARLKSPKVINEFLNNKSDSLKNYFSLKNSRFKNEVYQKRLGDWKEAHGLPRNATKAMIKAAGFKDTEFNKFAKDIRKDYWSWLEKNDPAEYARQNDIINLAESMDNEKFLNAADLARMRINSPDLYDAFISKVRSATRSKAQETDVPYKRGDINAVGDAIIEQMNEESGFRHQSWSDFQAMHLLDTISAVIELSTKRAKVHTYTKVPDMVRFLGDTGMMINMSLIPNGNTGLNEDGSLDFDPVEGMAFDIMKDLRKDFPQTAGNIAIGITDEQILALLASDDIDYVIPYHTSGLNADMRKRMGIRAWRDYTKWQNESGDGDAPALREWFNAKEAQSYADGYAYMVKASEKYLDLCYERGLTPKFPQFLTKDSIGKYHLRDDAQNYWKLLVDRKMVNQITRGVIIQKPIVPRFNENTMLDILNEEVNSQAAKDAREAEDFIVNKLLNEPAVFSKAEIEQARILRDAAIRMAIENTAGTVQLEARVTPEENARYLELAKDPDANEAELELMVAQAARAAGYDSPRLYHGTNRFGFTQIDTKKSNDRISFFATDSTETAGTYSGTNAPRDIITADNQSSLGMYQFYANTDGMLELDADGAESNHIRLGETEHDYNYDSNKKSWYTHATAKQIAQFAKRNGYTGVIIKNVIDTGTPTSRATASPATVYIFFDPQAQVKSADPVTYDDSGNVIPLTERFNSENEDIRFQERTETITNRDLLVNALDTVVGTEQKKILDEYRAKVSELNDKAQQLADIRSEIHDTMFTKGSDRSKLAELNNRADILQKQIDRADKRLTNIEAMEPIKRLLESERNKARKAQAEKDRETLRNYRESRSKTELRQNIRKVAEDFKTRLEKPTGRKYIPKELVSSVVELMEAIDTVTPRTLKDGTVREMSATAEAKAAELTALYTRLKNDESFSAAYDPDVHDKIVNMTSLIGKTPVNDMSLAQLQAVYDTLKAVRKTVMQAAKLKFDEFQHDIWETGSVMIRETRDAAPLIKGKIAEYLNAQLSPDRFFERMAGYKKDSEWAKVGHMFSEGTKQSLAIQRDFYNTFRELSEKAKFIDRLTDYSKKNLVDIGLVDADGNPVLMTRGMMLSVYMHLQNKDNIRAIFYGGLNVPVLSKYYSNGGQKAYDGGVRAFPGTSEQTYKQNREKLKEAARLQDERAELRTKRAELNKAGEDTSALKTKIDELTARIDAITAEVDRTEAEGMKAIARINEAIKNQLTEDEEKLIEKAHDWYDHKSRDYINAVTMDMYDYKKANVDNYYTIHRDTNYLNATFDNIAKDVNLENWGSLKERVPSVKPVYLTDIMFEMDNHVQSLSKYCGYVRAVRDFEKLYSVTVDGSTDLDSVQAAVANVFGSQSKNQAMLRTGQDYIKEFLGDIVGGKTQPNLLGAFRGYVARGSLTLNLRVALSQAASIPTAAAQVGWGSMLRGFAKSLPTAFSKSAHQELAQKSVYFWQRYRGEGGMREFSEAKGTGNRFDRLYNKLARTKVGRHLLNWCQDVDVWSTYTMWAMAEDWVEHNTDLNKGTAEFDKAVEQKYDDIIRYTQPNYTTTERSDLLRNKSEAVKTFTMFKTQPNQNFNILYEATARARKFRKDFKTGKNGVTAADVKRANAGVANAYTAVVVGAPIAFIGFRFLANAAMQALSYLRDDDDEITAESVAKGLTMEYASSMLGMFLFGGQIYDFVSPLMTGGKYYGPSDAALELVSGYLEQTFKLLQKAKDPTQKVSAADWEKQVQKLSSAFGIPYSNVKKMVKGIGYWIEDAQDDTLFKFEASAERTNSMQYSRLFKSLGDIERFDTIYEETKKQLMTGGKSEKDAVSLIKSKVKEEVKDSLIKGDITDEQAIEILTKYDVFEMGEDDAYWVVQKWRYNVTKTEDDPNFSEYGKLYDALKTGQGVDAAKKNMLTHGYDEKAISKQIRVKTKEWYESGDITEQQARTILSKYTDTENVDGMIGEWSFARKYGVSYDDRKSAYNNGDITREQLVNAMIDKGYTREEAEDQATLYDWQNMGYNGDKTYDIVRYRELAQPAGIPESVFINFCNNIKNVSGYKQEDKLPLIDSLNLTVAQKDALWYCCDWKESTLYKKAPWH